jgi:diadenosine tetraphosphatase ApaH/serine/threonine PP2A family protein phosphatase
LKALLLSDIHSNAVALQAVLHHASVLGAFDEVWVAGDTVGYGPSPNECIDILREQSAIVVAGNHDLAAVGKIDVHAFNSYAAAAIRWTKEVLTPESTKYLNGLSTTVTYQDFTIVHGSPRDPVWEYLMEYEAAEANLEHFDTAHCVIGHSHLPLVFTLEEGKDPVVSLPMNADEVQLSGRAFVNPGSVGQPRDGNNMASYAVVDTVTDSVMFHRVEYDIAETQRRMKERELPQVLFDRIAMGR